MEKNQASGAAFNPFDWFVVVVVLRFNGSTSCADDLLNPCASTKDTHRESAPTSRLFYFSSVAQLGHCNSTIRSWYTSDIAFTLGA
ncbi:hypothetical protein TSMEX_000571, partial [Taenia solium]